MGQRLSKLTQVWVCSPTRQNIDGEHKTIWKYEKIDRQGVFLNLQQDLDELDRNSAGNVDYDIQKARTTRGYTIEKGWGICLSDISNTENIVPDYIVSNKPSIGNTTILTLKRYNGE